MPDCLSSSGVKDEWVIKLILKDQNFPTLQTSSFSQFINLQHLDLSSSNVATIEDFWLANVDSLVILHLYNNYMTKLQTGMFDHMTKLNTSLCQIMKALLSTQQMHGISVKV